MENNQIYAGSPSQYVNTPYYLLCLLLLPVAGLGLILFLVRYLKTRYTRIEINTERMIERTGVFSRKTDELELYRIKDIRHEEPFFLRIFGLSNLVLYTSDKSSPVVVIRAIENGEAVRRLLRDAVEARRVAKGVRETDID